MYNPLCLILHMFHWNLITTLTLSGSFFLHSEMLEYIIGEHTRNNLGVIGILDTYALEQNN